MTSGVRDTLLIFSICCVLEKDNKRENAPKMVKEEKAREVIFLMNNLLWKYNHSWPIRSHFWITDLSQNLLRHSGW